MGIGVDKILGRNGLLLGLSYCKASTRRGAVLSITLGRKSASPLLTSLMVDGKDFHEVYAEAVRLIAEFWGVSNDAEIMARLNATKETFLSAKSLMVREVRVVYSQVEPIIATGKEGK